MGETNQLPIYQQRTVQEVMVQNPTSETNHASLSTYEQTPPQPSLREVTAESLLAELNDAPTTSTYLPHDRQQQQPSSFGKIKNVSQNRNII